MLRILFGFSFLAAIGVDSTLIAQPPEFPTPTKEHQWLKQFVGKWESQSEGSMGPGQPVMKCKGTLEGRMLGGFWLVNELQGDVMGTPMTSIQTIGYDPAAKKYVGTWVDSMMNHLWNYQGSVDATGKILTLDAMGPNFMAEGKLTKFRDAYEFKSADHVIATSSMMGEDGQWIVFMTGDMTRQPAAGGSK